MIINVHIPDFKINQIVSKINYSHHRFENLFEDLINHNYPTV